MTDLRERALALAVELGPHWKVDSDIMNRTPGEAIWLHAPGDACRVRLAVYFGKGQQVVAYYEEHSRPRTAPDGRQVTVSSRYAEFTQDYPLEMPTGLAVKHLLMLASASCRVQLNAYQRVLGLPDEQDAFDRAHRHELVCAVAGHIWAGLPETHEDRRARAVAEVEAFVDALLVAEEWRSRDEQR